MRQIGSGQKTFDYELIEGVWQRLEGPNDVVEFMDSGAAGVIAIVRDAGATFLSPIFADLAGVICTGGTIRSHIGIISREFQIPGLVAAEFSDEPENGSEIFIDGREKKGKIMLVQN